MLNALATEKGRLIPLAGERLQESLEDAIWVDLLDPEPDERDRVSRLYRQILPETEDVEEIEASARFYEDAGGLHIHSLFLQDIDGRPRNTSVAFTVTSDRLFTLREREVPAFRLLRMRARRHAGLADDAMSILLNLIQIKIDDLADTLEEVYTGLEKISALVLEDNDADMEDALDDLAVHEDISGKVRLCLMDTQRALTFLQRRGRLGPEHAQQVRELAHDIESLLPHNSFVFDKINFLMDAAQGFINIEQNQIIKIFSIAAVVFLPPTLIASIYGMNFAHMPELGQPWAYPAALVGMVLSAIAPYAFFRYKGWL